MMKIFRQWIILCMAVVPSLPFPCNAFAQGVTTRVSVDSLGNEANHTSEDPSISADGRYVAFSSFASNLVTGDTNNVKDIFLHDRQTGQTIRVSVSSAGVQGNERSLDTSISADGRYVAFTSAASNFVSGETNDDYDIFVHDRVTGQTTCASVNSAGAKANNNSYDPSISGDGRYVAFDSEATNLVSGTTRFNVFVHDRLTGQTTRVSESSAGVEGNAGSGNPSISADGRYVAFHSYADNLVPDDTNGQDDIFVHDRETGETTRVSVSSAGEEGNRPSVYPSISADGRYVAFWSLSWNLVPGDDAYVYDAFVHDRQTGQTTLMSVDSAGVAGNGDSKYPGISPDGRYVTFHSAASNLVTGDSNAVYDVFVHDRQTAQTIRVSKSTAGVQGNDHSTYSAICLNGRVVGFFSQADNLVAGDTDVGADIFVHVFACECDLNDDGKCDMQDWLLFGEDWGRTDCNVTLDCECDLNGDGVCDMQDWLLFGQDWGRTDCP